MIPTDTVIEIGRIKDAERWQEADQVRFTKNADKAGSEVVGQPASIRSLTFARHALAVLLAAVGV
ncbi:MAG: hypothetical protein U0822_08560 [Anaerolineae bacterium]